MSATFSPQVNVSVCEYSTVSVAGDTSPASVIFFPTNRSDVIVPVVVVVVGLGATSVLDPPNFFKSWKAPTINARAQIAMMILINFCGFADEPYLFLYMCNEEQINDCRIV